MERNINGLADVLFSQLDRLNNSNLSGNKLTEEISRASAVCGVSKQLLDITNTGIKASVALGSGQMSKTPKMLEG